MNKYLIPNLVKACEMMSILAERPQGISAAEMEQLVQVPRTTAFRVLKTLCAQGVAEKHKGLFFAGPRLVQIGLKSLQSQEIRSVAIPILSDLAMKTDLTAYLAVPNQWKSLILEVHDSPNPVRVASRPGTIVPLHCSSTGKVFLAFCYEDQIGEYFSQTVVTKFTDATIVAPDAMKREIEQIKTQGYAVDSHELHENVVCVAAPVRDNRGQVMAAIGVTGPSMQFSQSSVPDISQIVIQSANELSAVMGYHVYDQKKGLKMKTTLSFSAVLCLSLLAGCTLLQASKPLPSDMQPEQIKSIMVKVADWQLANPSKNSLTDWTHGALFAGMMEWAHMADSDKYYEALKEFGEKTDWQLGKRPYHADDHAVGQMYIDMYNRFKYPEMVATVQKQLDWILANQPDTPLTHDNNEHKKRYNWCDALFMAPPVWAKLARITGQSKYLDYMNKEWWATTDYLYDKDERLYFRDDRYFTQREANDEKIFWSRGNGWVFGGLVRVLAEMPDDYPDRDKYIILYKEMATRLVEIQPEEGLWHSSLLDPRNFPKETSGSGFYCYGLAWGINHGYLNESDYLPAVIKAWTGLVDCVHPDGKLGFVQPMGADPRPAAADMTEVYGVGAFLLAGSEVYKIAVRDGQDVTVVTATNPGLFFRDSETIALEKSSDKTVFDLQTNKLLVTQPIDGQLLFQTDLAPGEKKTFWVMDRPQDLKEPESTITTYCRFIPERKDDFGWENDKAAYRMYGPALEYETITSGIDAWGKCVPYPVIDKFIRDNNEKKIPYHYDHGEGGDFYKVGPTLGCGGMAPFIDGKVCLPRNFVEWKVLANGPIRSVFELTYKPWQAGDFTVSETKRISIDLGSNMSRVECRYASENTDTLPVAAGIILRETSDKTWTGDQAIAYWLPTDLIAGMFGCGVVFGSDYKTETVQADSHLLLTLKQTIDTPIVYYAGSCWDKNEEFNSFEKWQAYLTNFKQRLDTPVRVELEKVD